KKIFILIERLEPFPISYRILRVVVIKQRAHVFARETARQQIGDVIAGKRTKIETRTVKWIDETGRVSDCSPAVATNFFAPIRERGESVDVTFDRLCLTEDSAPDGMRNRSEEHTSELQSRFDLVCRLLLEKKNNMHYNT